MLPNECRSKYKNEHYSIHVKMYAIADLLEIRTKIITNRCIQINA